MEREGTEMEREGRRAPASALHALKGQMVTVGNWGANHTAGHRARDQQREGDRGREESERMQRSGGEEHLRGSCTPALTEGGEDWVLLLSTNKEAESKKRRGEKQRRGRRWGDSKRRKESISPVHLESYRQREGKQKGVGEPVKWKEGGRGRKIVGASARLINERLRFRKEIQTQQERRSERVKRREAMTRKDWWMKDGSKTSREEDLKRNI